MGSEERVKGEGPPSRPGIVSLSRLKLYVDGEGSNNVFSCSECPRGNDTSSAWCGSDCDWDTSANECVFSKSRH